MQRTGAGGLRVGPALWQCLIVSADLLGVKPAYGQSEEPRGMNRQDNLNRNSRTKQAAPKVAQLQPHT